MSSSDSSSDNDGVHVPRGWTIVNEHGDIETSDEGSDIVTIESNVAFYHHKEAIFSPSDVVRVDEQQDLFCGLKCERTRSDECNSHPETVTASNELLLRCTNDDGETATIASLEEPFQASAKDEIETKCVNKDHEEEMSSLSSSSIELISMADETTDAEQMTRCAAAADDDDDDDNDDLIKSSLSTKSEDVQFLKIDRSSKTSDDSAFSETAQFYQKMIEDYVQQSAANAFKPSESVSDDDSDHSDFMRLSENQEIRSSSSSFFFRDMSYQFIDNNEDHKNCSDDNEDQTTGSIRDETIHSNENDSSSLSSFLPWLSFLMNLLNLLFKHLTLVALIFIVGFIFVSYFDLERKHFRDELEKLQQLQNDYKHCLNEKSILEISQQSESDSERKLTVVSTIWQKKYEELMIERSELEHQLQQAVEKERNEHSMNDHFKKIESDYLEKKEAEILILRKIHEKTSLDLSQRNAEVDKLKNCEAENTQFKTILLNHRQLEEPENSAVNLKRMKKEEEEDEIDEIVNNEDDGERYNDKPTLTTQSRDFNVEDLTYLLNMLNRSLDNSLFKTKINPSKINNTSSSYPIFISFMKFIVKSSINITHLNATNQISFYRDIAQQIGNCIDLLENRMASGAVKYDFLSFNWEDIQETTDKDDACEKFIEFEKSLKTGDSRENPEPVESGTLKHYINKTLKSIQKIGQTIQNTMNRVKKQIFNDHKRAFGQKFKKTARKANENVKSGYKKLKKKAGQKIKNVMNELKERVKSGWKKINMHLLNMRSNWFNGMKHDEDNVKIDEEKISSDDIVEEDIWKKDSQSSDEYLNLDYFDRNRFHAEVEEMNPLYQKQMKKAGDGIEKLNERRFFSMDSEDIEEVIEDLEELNNRLRREKLSDWLTGWMSCQMKWWKMRTMNDKDLLSECRQWLVKWQIKVLCKVSDDKVSQGCQDVLEDEMILSNVDEKNAEDEEMINLNRQDQKKIEIEVNMQDHSATKNLELSGQEIENEIEREIEECNNSEWYFRRGQIERAHSNWYFERMEERETSRHDPGWYLRAMQRSSAHNMPKKKINNENKESYRKNEKFAKRFRGCGN